MRPRDKHALEDFWEKRIIWLWGTAGTLRRTPTRARDKLGPRESRTKAKLHIPLLAKLLDVHDMGNQAWLKQFVDGFPAIGELAEPGVYKTAKAEPLKLSREKLLGGRNGGTNFTKARKDPSTRKLWEEALQQVVIGWLDGPFEHTDDGCLRKGGQKISADPAFRFAVQQAD